MSSVPHNHPGPASPPRVALFVTCMVDTLYPAVGWAAAELLRGHGAEVLFPEAQTCCGQPLFNAGHRDAARRVARHFLDVFWPLVDRGAVEAVVAPSGSCVAMVRHHFETLFADEAAGLGRVRQLRDHTYELTEYLVDVLGVKDTGATFAGKLAYHPCCHLLRELGVDAQPRALLGAVRGADLVALPAAAECCGFGGLFAIKNAPISTAMGRRKMRHVAGTGAEVVAVNDVSCMTHLNGLFAREQCACRAVHIAEVLHHHEG